MQLAQSCFCKPSCMEPCKSMVAFFTAWRRVLNLASGKNSTSKPIKATDSFPNCACCPFQANNFCTTASTGQQSKHHGCTSIRNASLYTGACCTRPHDLVPQQQFPRQNTYYFTNKRKVYTSVFMRANGRLTTHNNTAKATWRDRWHHQIKNIPLMMAVWARRAFPQAP